MTRLRLLFLAATAGLALLIADRYRPASDTMGAVSPVSEPSRRMDRMDLVVPSGGPTTEGLVELQRARSAESDWGRDPFMDPRPLEPLSGPIGDPPIEARTEGRGAAPGDGPEPERRREEDQMRLTGISRSGSRRWAIIDREIVQEGDALATGHRISRIDARSVTLMLDREAVVLTMDKTR